MTHKEKIALLRNLLKDFINYDWSDGKCHYHYDLTLQKYSKVRADGKENKCLTTN